MLLYVSDYLPAAGCNELGLPVKRQRLLSPGPNFPGGLQGLPIVVELGRSLLRRSVPVSVLLGGEPVFSRSLSW